MTNAQNNFSFDELENINKSMDIDPTNGAAAFHPGSLTFSIDTTFNNNEEIYMMLQQYQNSENQQHLLNSEDIQGQNGFLVDMNNEFE